MIQGYSLLARDISLSFNLLSCCHLTDLLFHHIWACQLGQHKCLIWHSWMNYTKRCGVSVRRMTGLVQLRLACSILHTHHVSSADDGKVWMDFNQYFWEKKTFFNIVDNRNLSDSLINMVTMC